MTENEIHFRNTYDCIKKIKSIRTMYRDTTPSYVALSDAIQALEEIQQCREYKEIFESHFSEEVLKLLSNKEEFGKWLERGKWIAKKCDEINRELEQYRAIDTIDKFKDLKEKSVAKKMSIGNDNGKSRKCCGNCRCFVLPTSSYCSKCGQKIDWQ